MHNQDNCRQILAELDRVLSGVADHEVNGLVEAILGAKRIVVYGLGREGLAMRSFAMRLMHLGLSVSVVGDMTTPPVGPDDLFLVSCGPGYLSTVEALMLVAGKAGANVLMITAEPNAELPKKADRLLVIPAQTMAVGEGSESTQAMGSAFEQAMWILFDALVPTLQSLSNQTAEQLRARHTNLE